ncbi:MAG: hypothetical protein HKN14_16485 [Marinicaulis sp.]|nr:hypothetical protein [Marinicaulis sp.]
MPFKILKVTSQVSPTQVFHWYFLKLAPSTIVGTTLANKEVWRALRLKNLKIEFGQT